MSARRQRDRVAGFTIIELVVTILVAAILTAIAVPQFQATLQRYRQRSAVADLQASLQYARTESVLRATYVSLCASADGATCSGATTYETGWLVYVHPVATTSATDTYTANAASGMQILRVATALNQVSARALDGAVVTFGQQGQLEPVASRTNASQPMAFVVCAVTGGTATLGSNTSRVPGSRLAVSRFGAVAASRLDGTGTCLP
jgi:prepilin-type N-terminal cleavage/methylation domain-containing protein